MGMIFCPDALAWGDVATWVSGLATVAAVIIALCSIKAAERDRRAEIDAQTRAVADAICDELRAINWRLEQIQQLDADAVDFSTMWKAYARHTKAIVTPVLDILMDRMHLTDATTAAVVTSAYGNILRLRALIPPEAHVNPGRPEAPGLREAVRTTAAIVGPIRPRVVNAVRALWPYTPHAGEDPFGTEPIEAE